MYMYMLHVHIHAASLGTGRTSFRIQELGFGVHGRYRRGTE